MNYARTLAGGLVASLALACGEDEITFPEPITSIQVAAGTCGNLKTGQTCALEARVRDATGELVPDVQLFWSTIPGNSIFATVTFEGEVTARMAGPVQIVAALPNSSIADTIQLVITDPPDPPEPPQ